MDGTKFAKMLSDKHLFELDRLAYKYSVADVKEFSELLRQNFVQPLPLVDFTGQAIVCLPNLAQISTSGMKQLLSVPAESQPFGVQAMTEEIHATLQIENIHSTRNSIRHILNGNASRNEDENRIYSMKRGLDFIADQQNEITEENLHRLYQISTGEYLPAEDKLLPDHFYRHDAVYIVGGEESRKGLSDKLLPQVMKQLIDFANAEDDLNELHKAAILKGGIRKSNQAGKYVFGYRLFDKVQFNGQDCFVWRRRTTGIFTIKTINGKMIKDGISFKKLKLVEKSTGYLIA